ncbi:MAG: DUF1266 domain-containing protein [Rickettsiales bacterium]|jgi:hypothetical protein|nr:DUF1266 domain-containing protein [Rickettsiales bacterium]
MQFDENYFNMIRANLKMTGVSDDQIEAMIKMQQASMGGTEISAQDIAEAAAAAGRIAEQMGGFGSSDAESELVLVENPSVNKSYQWAIACGADLAQMRGDILNDLNTDVNPDGSDEVLKEGWGVSGHDEAVEMCDSLLAARHSSIYAAEVAAGKGEHIDNINAAKILFNGDGLIGGNTVPNMLIWDLGRLVTVSRLAFDAGWLSRDEVLKYLCALAPMVQKAYKSWRDMSVAYQFGRVVWGGPDEEEYLMMKSNMQELLEAADSPWNKLPFDMKLEF